LTLLGLEIEYELNLTPICKELIVLSDSSSVELEYAAWRKIRNPIRDCWQSSKPCRSVTEGPPGNGVCHIKSDMNGRGVSRVANDELNFEAVKL
jgi:hypothetical protein